MENAMLNTMKDMYKNAADQCFAMLDDGLKMREQMREPIEKKQDDFDASDLFGDFGGEVVSESIEFGRKAVVEADEFACEQIRKSIDLARRDFDQMIESNWPMNWQTWNAMTQTMWKDSLDLARENMDTFGAFNRKQLESFQQFSKKWQDRSRAELDKTMKNSGAGEKTSRAKSSATTKA